MSHRHLSRLALGALVALAACNKDEPAAPAPTSPPAGEGKPSTPAAPTPAPAPAPTPVPTSPPSASAGVPIDSAAIAEIGEVVATVQIPSGTAMSDLAPVVDNFQPGASLLISTQAGKMLGELLGTTLDGAKLDAPISIVVVDPSKHPKPAALLVTAADVAKLEASAKASGLELRVRDGAALVGPADVVAAAEGYAFANLAKAPDHTEVVVYPRPLVAAFGPQIDAGLAAMGAAAPPGMAPAMGWVTGIYGGFVHGLGQHVDRIVVSVHGEPGISDLYLRFYPTAGSTFAAVVAAQQATDHALLSQLPAGEGATIVASGVFVGGPARDAMVGWGSDLMATMFGGKIDAATWRSLFEGWLVTMDGRFAMHAQLEAVQPMPTMRMTALYGVTSAEAARKSWREMMGKLAGVGPLELMGMKMTLSFSEAAMEHDGIPIDRYGSKTDTSALPPEMGAAMRSAGTTEQQFAIATFDEVALMTSAREPDAIGKAIDAARGKADRFTPPAALAAALAASKARADSLLYYLAFPDTGPIQLPMHAVAVGVGKQGDALSVCLSLQK